MGGSKISTKISIIKNLAKKMSAIAICGGMANSFLEYQGFNIGKSLAEKNVQNIIQDIFDFQMATRRYGALGLLNQNH